MGGKGLESLGKDVHLIVMAEGLMRNHLQRNVHSSLGKDRICHFQYVNVWLLDLYSKLLSFSPDGGAGGLLHGGKELYLSVSSVTVFF